MPYLNSQETSRSTDSLDAPCADCKNVHEVSDLLESPWKEKDGNEDLFCKECYALALDGFHDAMCYAEGGEW